jgi:hypothetical protein
MWSINILVIIVHSTPCSPALLLHCTTLNDTSFLINFTLCHFTSPHFTSLHCTSLHFTSLQLVIDAPKFTKWTCSCYFPLKQLLVSQHVTILPEGYEVIANQVIGLPINFVGQSPSSECSSSSTSQEICLYAMESESYYRADIWARWVHSTPFQPISLTFILILSICLRLGLSVSLFPSGLPTANAHVLSFVPVYHMHCPSYVLRFGHWNNVPRGVQIVTPPPPTFILFSAAFLRLCCRSRYLPQHPVFEHPQSLFFPACDGPSYTSMQQNQIKVLDILIITFSGSIREDERFWNEWHSSFTEFLISWYVQFLCGNVTPKYLIFATFLKDLVATLCCDVVKHSGHETWTYT